MTNPTTLEADPNLPTIRVVREFEAPPERVYRAWVEPDLLAKWLGPSSLTTNITHFDARTGGSYRYESLHNGTVVASFYGSFHELRPAQRIVQTFTFEGVPDGVCLETMTFSELPGERTRITSVSVFDSIENRDGMIASGMESGVVDGYSQLDELLDTL